MKNKQVLEIAKIYKSKILDLPSNDEYEHIVWMLDQIVVWIEGMEENCPCVAEKTHRWLGFIQGFLWTKKIFTIEEMKLHNSAVSL